MSQRPPVSIIPGDPRHSLFNRVERTTTANPLFNLRVKQIAHFIGYVYEYEEIVYQPGEAPPERAPELAGTTIEKLENLVKELEEVFKQQNKQGQSGIKVNDQDTRTVDLRTGIISLGRELIEGETFNQFNGLVYRRKPTNPPLETKKGNEGFEII